MSTFDVPPDEMGWDPKATDDALERMLSGQAPTSDEWREVVGLVEDLNEAVPARPLASEDLHVAAMVETSHLIADDGDPVARPVSNADAPASQVSRLPKLRRKPMKRSTRILVRAFAPVAAVFAVMGSMAYAGALPHTVQKAVSHAAGTVGINLPGDDEAQGENDDSQGDNNNQGEDSTTDTVVPTTDQGDQGESSDTQSSADDQGENDDSQGDNNNQGEDAQSGDTSGDTQSGVTQSGDSQGDTSGDPQSGDSQGDTPSGDTQSGDSQGDNSQG